VAEAIEFACRHSSASTDVVIAPYASMREGLRQERQALEAQGLGNVACKLIELAHIHRGVPVEDTKVLLSKWAPTTRDAYGGIFSGYYRYAHSRSRSVLIPSDVLLAAYLTSKCGVLAGKTVAIHASAIGKLYALAYEVRIQNSELVSSAVEAAKVAIPSEARYDENFSFRPIDEYVCQTLAVDNGQLLEPTLLAKAIHLLARYLWCRPGELRGVCRERMQLYFGASRYPSANTTFDEARRLDLTIQGTKTGSGPKKMSTTLTIHRPRAWVIGDTACNGLDLFPALAELERRYAGRKVGPRKTPKKGYVSKHDRTHRRYGPGFFLSLHPEEESGEYFYLGEDTIRKYGQKMLTAAEIPTKFKPHSVRHAAISLLRDANVPASIVASRARHTKKTADKIYRHPSDLQHQQRAAALLKDVPSATCEELLCCALTRPNQKTSPIIAKT